MEMPCGRVRQVRCATLGNYKLQACVPPVRIIFTGKGSLIKMNP